MRGSEGPPVSWWSSDLAEAQVGLRGVVLGRHGMLRVRLVEELPRPVHLRPSGTDEVVPVLAIDEVERAHPDLAEVLARLRARRQDAART
jgi:hypothetical protein